MKAFGDVEPLKRSDSDVYEGMRVVTNRPVRKNFEKLAQKNIPIIEGNPEHDLQPDRYDHMEDRFNKQIDDVKTVMLDYKEMFQKLERILGCSLIDGTDDLVSDITESRASSKMESKDLFEF